MEKKKQYGFVLDEHLETVESDTSELYEWDGKLKSSCKSCGLKEKLDNQDLCTDCYVEV